MLQADGSHSAEVEDSMTGRQLRQMISAELPSKDGSRILLQHRSSPLSLDQTLRQQGIVGEGVTLSYLWIPVNVYAAWQYLQGEPVEDQEEPLEGLTQIAVEVPFEVIISVDELLQNLPDSLEHLTLKARRDLTDVNFPSGLKSLNVLNSSLYQVSLPPGLQSLAFIQSMNGVTLPASL